MYVYVCVRLLSLQVDVIKEAYLQGVESEVDVEVSGDEISPKDVGHNIYILAHQVIIYLIHILYSNLGNLYFTQV